MEIVNLNCVPHWIPLLAQWQHRQWSFLNPQDNLEKRIARLKCNPNAGLIPSTFVAQKDGLLGSAAIVENDLESKPELSPWLASVFVFPEHRGQGIGSALVKYVMERAKEAGIPVLYLFTPDKEPFYLKLGWETLSREVFRGHPITIMKTNLFT
jgi:GNAT superfamily N-acetyltransferase